MMSLYLGCWWFVEIKLVWQLTVCGKSFKNLTTSPENSAISQAVWLSHRAISANKNCVNLHLPTTIRKCVCNITCTQHVHTHEKRVQTWLFLPEICYSKKKALFLHGPSIIITWVMQFPYIIENLSIPCNLISIFNITFTFLFKFKHFQSFWCIFWTINKWWFCSILL